MDLSAWFEKQLQAGADGLVWAVEQVPRERQQPRPPSPAGGLGEWTVARHAFHVLHYERVAALPAMQHWLEAPLPPPASYDEDAAWAHAPELTTVLERFRAVREAQIALLPRFSEAAWEEPRDTEWGRVPLRWIVSKTYQHTAEHTSDILRIALFWDMFAFAEQRRRGDDEASAIVADQGQS